jgi:hypothetical protein
MKITRSAFAKAVAKQLAPGKRINSAEVQKTLQQMGVDPRFKGEVKEYQLNSAFETLKEKGLLKSSASATGNIAFKDSVKREAQHEAHPGLSKEKQLAHSKALLRERLDEEAAKKQRMTDALNNVQKGTKGEGKSGGSHTAGNSLTPPAIAKAPIGHVREREGDVAMRSAAVQDVPVARDGSSAIEGQGTSRPNIASLPSRDQRTQEPPDMFGPEE